MKLYISFLILSVLFLMSSCSKDESLQTIPWARVQFKLDLNSWDAELNSPTGNKVFTSARLGGEYMGYGGLLVVAGLHSTDGTPVLYTYDLSCPHEQSRTVLVEPATDGMTATCKACGSVYNIIEGYGNPTSGPSGKKMTKYSTIPERPYVGVFRVIN